MWMKVMNAANGVPITNASFSLAYGNYGGGWYWVAAGYNQLVLCNAGGYNSLWFNTNGWNPVYIWLSVYVPPPTTYGNCWSG